MRRASYWLMTVRRFSFQPDLTKNIQTVIGFENFSGRGASLSAPGIAQQFAPKDSPAEKKRRSSLAREIVRLENELANKMRARIKYAADN